MTYVHTQKRKEYKGLSFLFFVLSLFQHGIYRLLRSVYHFFCVVTQQHATQVSLCVMADAQCHLESKVKWSSCKNKTNPEKRKKERKKITSACLSFTVLVFSVGWNSSAGGRNVSSITIQPKGKRQPEGLSLSLLKRNVLNHSLKDKGHFCGHITVAIFNY